MEQVGFTKGADGFFRGPSGPIALEIATVTSPASVSELQVMANGLRLAGFDVQQRVIPAAQAQDNQVRSSYPGMFTSTTNSGEPAMGNLVSSQIPSANTRWLGGNRGAFISSEYDRLFTDFYTTVDRGERVQQMRQMLRIFAENLPLVSLFFRGSAFAHVSDLRGPGPAAPEANPAWNIHLWEFN